MMNFIKPNSFPIVGLALYFSWWIYVLFSFVPKEYDNSLAGATASLGIAYSTVAIILLFLLCFLGAAFATGKWKKYAACIALTLTPPFIFASYVMSNIESYKPH
jgi:hypothetical protein